MLGKQRPTDVLVEIVLEMVFEIAQPPLQYFGFVAETRILTCYIVKMTWSKGFPEKVLFYTGHTESKIHVENHIGLSVITLFIICSIYLQTYCALSAFVVLEFMTEYPYFISKC